MTGFEPLIAGAAAAAANKLAELVIETGWGGGGGVLGRFRTAADERTKQLIFNASQQYVENYRKRHCLLKVLGMREPVSLESIYTTVRFLDSKNILQLRSVEALKQSYQRRGERGFHQKTDAKHKGIEVSNAEPFLVVLGQPGAGKSTFLRKMGLEALKGKHGEFKHRCIPVFIELKQFNDYQIGLEQIVVSEFETCGFPNARGFTRKALEQGKLLILLDGLDEVPTDSLNLTIRAIEDFVDRHDKNRYIASCRTAAYRSIFRRFKDVAMAEFDNDQIQQFIENWFQSDTDKAANMATKCWTTLQKPEYAAAKELAHTPLLLTFLCLVYDRSQNFPNNRSILYRKALRILLEEWAADKRLENQRQIYEGLSVELEEVLLSELACQGFATNQLFFSQREIVKKIREFLASNLNAPTHLDGEAVLKAIVVQQGILVERAEDVYSFSHLTLQEYLTAQYIDDHHQIERLVQHCLTARRWREVFLLVAGIMRGGADELLLLMEKQSQTYLRFSKLKALLIWAETATNGSVGEYSPVAKRATAIYLICIAGFTQDLNFNLAHNLALALSQKLSTARALKRNLVYSGTLVRDRDIALAFKELEIFQAIDFEDLIVQLKALESENPKKLQSINMRLHSALRYELVNQVKELWFDALHFNLDTATLVEPERTALSHYLYACELMVRCKESAVRVSPQVWAGIEDRMLRVID